MAQTIPIDYPAQVTVVEAREADATLTNSVADLEALWSDNLVVSSSANLVLNKKQALGLFRSGRIRLKTFERRISKLVVVDEIAMATGNETFTVKEDPTGKEPSPKDIFMCTYMNVWKHEGDAWKMIGRHVGFMAAVPAANAA